MVIAAFLALPTFEWSQEQLARISEEETPTETNTNSGITIRLPVIAQPPFSTVVSVPDGGSSVFGSIVKRADGTTDVLQQMPTPQIEIEEEEMRTLDSDDSQPDSSDRISVPDGGKFLIGGRIVGDAPLMPGILLLPQHNN